MTKIEELQGRLERAEEYRKAPIAIVGMGCRFPGDATDPQKFWQNLRSGVDAVTEVPASRWDADAWYDPSPETPGKTYCKQGGFIGEVDTFDPLFFGISPRDAINMDPQHRLLL
ncbi:MAG: beta-ketoacyl synthase N-terminal-like domain-containing protein, partial [Myxococcota bacterium]